MNRRLLYARFVGAAVLNVLVQPALAQENALPTRPAEGQAPQSVAESRKDPPGGIRPYMPGVRIDWTAKSVLLDAQVVLRQGPLELVACTPGTKEHESILVIRARPLHVQQAMGLIGLEPGKPVRFDEKADRWLAATGQPLDVLIRYDHGGKDREIRPEEWLVDVKTDKPPGAIQWVFAGSMSNDEGDFAADAEGTVITVVDFPTALIAPATLHTSDDSQLWLRANKETIPPLKTACTIVIQAAKRSDQAPAPAGVENASKPGDNPAAHENSPDKDPG